MKSLIATAIVAVMLSMLTYVPMTETPIHEDWSFKVEPSDITNSRALCEMRIEQFKAKLAELEEQRIAEEQAQQEQEYYEEEYYGQAYYEPTYYEPTYSGVKGDPDGLNSFVGVVEYGDTIETAYSSNVLYHYRTSEWQPDEFGFYRTDEGYYVVASNEYPEGTIIETSRGEAQVLDGGCAAGYIDFYTNW